MLRFAAPQNRAFRSRAVGVVDNERLTGRTVDYPRLTRSMAKRRTRPQRIHVTRTALCCMVRQIRLWPVTTRASGPARV